MPADERQLEAFGDRFGEKRLSGARLSANDEGAFERHRAVDGGLERVVDEITGRAAESAKLGHIGAAAYQKGSLKRPGRFSPRCYLRTP